MTHADSVFPLPLVAFERYMLADHRPEYPMAFVLAMRLSGVVRREAMEEAVRAALGRHPLLCATVDDSIPRRPCWIPAVAAEDLLDWGPAGAALVCPGGEAIDLTRRPGLRLWVRQGDGSATLWAQFHHPCCDGIGALGFLGDVLAQYGLRIAPSGARPEPVALDPGRLTTRGDFDRDAQGTLDRLKALAGTARHIARFARVRPEPLSPAQPAPIDPARREPFPGLHVWTFDVAESRRLGEAARRLGVTVNDLLLCALFRTIADSSVDGPRRPEDGWYRILMPANLRGPADAVMPAANVVAISFLTRRIGECLDGGNLLAGIRAETASVKRSRRGLHFLRTIQWAQAVFGHMPAAMVGPRCFASAVLSNLGDVGRGLAARFPMESGRLRAGNLVLEEVFGAPPLRPLTRAGFFVSRYGGRLGVSLRCDPRHFLPADADALGVRFCTQVKTHLGSASPAPYSTRPFSD